MTEKRRRIMRDFRISELSAVARPAQTHARRTIIKRADDKEQEDMNKIASFTTLDDAVEHLQNVHKCGRLEATQKAGRRFPDLVEKYNQEGEEIGKRAAEKIAKARAKPEAVEDFDRCVDEVAKRDSIPRHVAMSRATRENPAAFEAYQEA